MNSVFPPFIGFHGEIAITFSINIIKTKLNSKFYHIKSNKIYVVHSIGFQTFLYRYLKLA